MCGQVQTEELVKEVENSVAEFKNHKQEYDEERVQEQVSTVKRSAIFLLLPLIRDFVVRILVKRQFFSTMAILGIPKTG